MTEKTRTETGNSVLVMERITVDWTKVVTEGGGNAVGGLMLEEGQQ